MLKGFVDEEVPKAEAFPRPDVTGIGIVAALTVRVKSMQPCEADVGRVLSEKLEVVCGD